MKSHSLLAAIRLVFTHLKQATVQCRQQVPLITMAILIQGRSRKKRKHGRAPKKSNETVLLEADKIRSQEYVNVRHSWLSTHLDPSLLLVHLSLILHLITLLVHPTSFLAVFAYAFSFGYVMRREKLEHLKTTGMIKVKSSRGKQWEKMLDGLIKWWK